MSSRTIALDERLYAYLLDVTVPESEAQKGLRAETRRMTQGGMQISPEQGRFMSFLLRTLGVRHALEIGTFTGYSALCMASALPADGKLIGCDVSAEWTAVGQRFWRQAEVADRIDLRIGPAVETLAALRGEGREGGFDFAFIDADKENYDAYYEHCLALVRVGGVIAIDNVLWSGAVADPNNDKPSTIALKALNEKVFSDPRVDATMLPIGDGLTLARRV
jgi:predicted O-methyltransferase YrrM